MTLQSRDFELISMGVFTALMLVVLGVVYAVGKPVPVSKTDIQKPLPYPPGPYVPTPTKTMCLPSTTGSTGELVNCQTQFDCSGCVERPGRALMACVNAGSGVLTPQGKLEKPLTVDVPLTDTTGDCSGHGTQQSDGSCKCDGDPTKDEVSYTCGECAGKTGEEEECVCTSCDVLRLRVDKPGNYCLPAYTNKCNPATSNTIFTSEGTGGSGWTCECKEAYKPMFNQAVEGGSCDREIACGAQVPQLGADGNPIMFQVYDGEDDRGQPTFKSSQVFPNRVTSWHGSMEQCVVPTTRSEVSIQVGENEDSSPKYLQYTVFSVSGRADPTCKAMESTNVCRNGRGGIQQTMSGSGYPGNPEEHRVFPPFFMKLPQGMQRCPDGWSGDGSPGSPCKDPNGKKAWFYDNYGRYNGVIQNIEDIRSSTVPGSTQTFGQIPWKGVNADTGSGGGQGTTRDFECQGGGFCGGSEFGRCPYTVYNPDKNQFGFDFTSSYCVGNACQGANGYRSAEWDIERDGPLVDEHGQPYFVQNLNQYGGQCSCDGFVTSSDGKGGVNQVAGRAQYQLPGGTDTEDNWWTCAGDTCHSADAPLGYYDPAVKSCVCPNNFPDNKAPHFKTTIPWNPEKQPPKCIKDPCNPGGYASNINNITQVACSQDQDCQAAVKCITAAGDTLGHCYTKSAFTCSGTGPEADEQCKGFVFGLDGVCRSDECWYLDQARYDAGTVCQCDEEHECAACHTGKACHDGMCSAYCICDKNYDQVEDGTNPLGYTCQKKCEPGPCQNKATCSLDESTGERTCRCANCFNGDRCTHHDSENGPGKRCWNDDECCSKNCDKPKGVYIQGVCK